MTQRRFSLNTQGISIIYQQECSIMPPRPFLVQHIPSSTYCDNDYNTSNENREHFRNLIRCAPQIPILNKTDTLENEIHNGTLLMRNVCNKSNEDRLSFELLPRTHSCGYNRNEAKLILSCTLKLFDNDRENLFLPINHSKSIYCPRKEGFDSNE